MRKEKKASISQTVINRFGIQLQLAANKGVTPDECIGLCIEKGWQGFKFSWYENEKKGLRDEAPQKEFREFGT